MSWACDGNCDNCVDRDYCGSVIEEDLYALSKILETPMEDILIGDDEVSSFCA